MFLSSEQLCEEALLSACLRLLSLARKLILDFLECDTCLGSVLGGYINNLREELLELLYAFRLIAACSVVKRELQTL